MPLALGPWPRRAQSRDVVEATHGYGAAHPFPNDVQLWNKARQKLQSKGETCSNPLWRHIVATHAQIQLVVFDCGCGQAQDVRRTVMKPWRARRRRRRARKCKRRQHGCGRGLACWSPRSARSDEAERADSSELDEGGGVDDENGDQAMVMATSSHGDGDSMLTDSPYVVTLAELCWLFDACMDRMACIGHVDV